MHSATLAFLEKPWFPKNEPSLVVVPKWMHIAHFEPLFSHSHLLFNALHLSSASRRQSSFPHQLGPNILSSLGR